MYLIKLDAVIATSVTQSQKTSLNVSNIPSFSDAFVKKHKQPQTKPTLSEFPFEPNSKFIHSIKTQQAPLQGLKESIIMVQSTPEQPKESINSQNPAEPPQVEAQPNEPTQPTPTQIEQRLNKPDINYSQRVERLIRLLEKNKQPKPEASNTELGNIIARPRTREPQTSELGIVAQPRQIESPPLPTQPPPTKTPLPPSQPIAYLLGRVSFFQTDNLFASKVDPIEDGLIYSGVTLASAPLKLGPKTFLSGSFDANVIRYINQSEFNYNQLRLNVDLYQQLTRRMYGEIGWSNQQLFYAQNSRRYGFASGDRFLNENSFHLSFGRRDSLAPQWTLDSFYEFRWSLAEVPEKRDRITNTLWLSLSYYLLQPLNVGLNYQLSLSNFTQRDREDLYHRIFTHVNYKATDTSSISFQSGVTLGNSTEPNINFNGWFFSINYNWEIGRF
ncbi:hypothetical protein NIES4071_59890 [Calothrix sp. NIES-4071]|nr:hypothetical protein NIES4071_59890 [Calothrix sp. NIES-4071]BAZ60296.1 hypothetical protein NIES4105_59840 [Calothrix sp. NIES-4105]